MKKENARQRTVTFGAGDLLQVKSLKTPIGDRLVETTAPPGRLLVVQVLGVTDHNVPFQYEDMMRALGWQRIPEKEG